MLGDGVSLGIPYQMQYKLDSFKVHYLLHNPVVFFPGKIACFDRFLLLEERCMLKYNFFYGKKTKMIKIKQQDYTAWFSEFFDVKTSKSKHI